MKLKTKTQNIFCHLNENLTTFLYTLTGATRKQKEKKNSLVNCIQKSKVMKKIIWDYVFGIMYLVLVYPMTRSFMSNLIKKSWMVSIIDVSSFYFFFISLDRFCFQTKSNDQSSWWTVDLLDAFQIVAVNVTFAEDQSVPKR